jgi:two-component sensor histidine kinase
MNPHGFIAPGEPLVLVEELTHRVINEFTHAIMSIDEVARQTSNPEAMAVLSNAIIILRAYAAAHRALQAPHTSGPTKLGDYLARICRALSSARLREQGVQLTIRQGDITMDAVRCWRVGLIMAELINNAVRHGFSGGPGDIDIDCFVEGSVVRCRVSDNGREAMETPPARGRFLVEALASELGGEVGWHFSASGTTVVLTVPVQARSGRPQVVGRAAGGWIMSRA